jgi:hypothetical protein
MSATHAALHLLYAAPSRRPAHARLPAYAVLLTVRIDIGHNGLRPGRAAGERTAGHAVMSHATVALPDFHQIPAVLLLQGANFWSHHAHQRAAGAAAAGGGPRARSAARLPRPRLPHGMRFTLQQIFTSRCTLLEVPRPDTGSCSCYPQEPAARNWLYAHTQNFYDEMSLNSIGAPSVRALQAAK